MKKTSTRTGRNLKALGSILCISVAPLLTGLVVSGCAGDRYHESTGEHIDDTAITGRVKKALAADHQYKFDDVKVSTFKGTVQLSGFANTRDEKSRAAELAKAVPGARDVVNNITVKE